MSREASDTNISAQEKYLFQELTYSIIGAAMEVHNVLGNGFLEAVYQSALAHEFDLRGIKNQQQVEIDVTYKGVSSGVYKADFLVENQVIVEIKAQKSLTENEEAQLIHYLKGTGYRIGLLLNFGAPSLEKRRRIV